MCVCVVLWRQAVRNCELVGYFSMKGRKLQT